MTKLPVIAIFVLAAVTACANVSGWEPVAFDGQAFVKEAPSPQVLVRDGYLPARGAAAPREERLPPGTGAVAVFCYRQSSGGKLQPHPGVTPLAGVNVTLTNGPFSLERRTGQDGYLILPLPPGEYQLRLFSFVRLVTVQKGKTSLVAIRGGKRMVD